MYCPLDHTWQSYEDNELSIERKVHAILVICWDSAYTHIDMLGLSKRRESEIVIDDKCLLFLMYLSFILFYNEQK